MKLLSWNVNGIRGRFGEVGELVDVYQPDLLCLQKVRCNSGREEFVPPGYRALYSEADSGSWSGVMMYMRIPNLFSCTDDGIPFRINTPMLSKQGHLQVYHCHRFYLINAYVPYYNPSLEGSEEYRRDWDNRFLKEVKTLGMELPVVICGDLNVVHTEKDTFEPRLEQRRPNFTKWERDNFYRLLQEAELVDVFRSLHPETQAATFYGNFRDTGLGTRIDYFLVSRSMIENVTAAEILYDFGTGQSVPIMLEMNV